MMDDSMFLHVGPPVIRLLPIENLLQDERVPQVFRPNLRDTEIRRLVLDLHKLVGLKYDTIRVYSFIARLASERYFGLKRPLGPQAKNQLICTDAILSRMVEVSPQFRAGVQRVRRNLDVTTYRSWSINDIETLHRLCPALLARVRLPPVLKKQTPEQPTNLRAKTRALRLRVTRALPSPESLGEVSESLLQLIDKAANKMWTQFSPVAKAFFKTLLYVYDRLPVPLAFAARVVVVLAILYGVRRLSNSAFVRAFRDTRDFLLAIVIVAGILNTRSSIGRLAGRSIGAVRSRL
jgi:hypothetical protein